MSSRIASLALLAGLMCAAPAAALAAPAPTPAHAEPTRAASPAPAARAPAPAAPAPATRGDATRYADREARSGRVADYQGGSFVIVISGGALLVALLIALILI